MQFLLTLLTKQLSVKVRAIFARIHRTVALLHREKVIKLNTHFPLSFFFFFSSLCLLPGWLVLLSRKLLLCRTRCRVLGQCWGWDSTCSYVYDALDSCGVHGNLAVCRTSVPASVPIWPQSTASGSTVSSRIWWRRQATALPGSEGTISRFVQEKPRVSGTESGPNHTDGVKSFPVGCLEMGGWNAGWLRQLG